MAPIIIAQILDDLIAALDAARIAAAGDSRWTNAINLGYDWLLQQDAVEFDAAAHELTVPSPSGKVYHSNGACHETDGTPCKAFAQHNACYHRAASRLVRRALERQLEERLLTVFLAPNDAPFFALTATDQAAYWECYETMAAEFASPTRSQVRKEQAQARIAACVRTQAAQGLVNQIAAQRARVLAEMAECF